MNRTRVLTHVEVVTALAIGSALTPAARAQATAKLRQDTDASAIEVAALRHVARDPAIRGELLLDRPDGAVFDQRVA